ncbi:hypothetical protein [Plantactinospora soyae]|uniref:Uncharacterized protein n=1 Tax=Plantactinospora soyae TaxID=1544732 RepID=A0A927MBM0_9ACTN|nr:hypothetical protein [Plantactinospora soyae]MBE1491587.1 hypothetical protein [Plantactinospora soyae]
MPLNPTPNTGWPDVYARRRKAGPAKERRYGNFPTHAHYPEV